MTLRMSIGLRDWLLSPAADLPYWNQRRGLGWFMDHARLEFVEPLDGVVPEDPDTLLLKDAYTSVAVLNYVSSAPMASPADVPPSWPDFDPRLRFVVAAGPTLQGGALWGQDSRTMNSTLLGGAPSFFRLWAFPALPDFTIPSGLFSSCCMTAAEITFLLDRGIAPLVVQGTVGGPDSDLPLRTTPPFVSERDLLASVGYMLALAP